MPSKSKAQHRLMAAVAHDPAFAKKAGIPVSVGQDFVAADKQRFVDGGSVKATPRMPVISNAADLAKAILDFGAKPFGYDNPPVRMAIDALNLQAIPKTLDEISYGGALGTGSGMTWKPKADTVDAALMLAPTLAKTAPQLARGVKGALTLLANAPRAPLAGSRAAQQGVIKAPGGNWLSGSVEDALKGLKSQRPMASMVDSPETIAAWEAQNPGPKALNQFINKQLTRYVKNDMATERDPIRALAERGTLHVNPESLVADMSPIPRLDAREVSKTPLAKAWERSADVTLSPKKVDDFLRDYQEPGSEVSPFLGKDPWMATVPPTTPVYTVSDSRRFPSHLGFDHLIDELRNATNPASGLPPQLRLKPEDLAKVSVPQAVQRVAQINQWRAEQKAAADLARANNAATVLHKDYPEKGYKWVELKKGEQLPEGWSEELVDTPLGKLKKLRDPKTGGLTATDPREEALRDALKYEGDIMGHCVGGYCDDVASGNTRIFSLRDAKGQPHVTIEVAPQKRWNTDTIPNTEEDFGQRIVQIKGKQNRKPNDEYLPFVQDFVRSGKWSDVGDLENTGLVRASDVNQSPAFLERMRAKFGDDEWIDAKALDDWELKEKPYGYAEGGRVGMEHKQSHSQDASTQPLSGSALKALVRGWIAGTAGLPGDLEELARKGINWSFGPGGVNVDEQPFFRNTEGFKQSLPGKQPGDEAMGTAGSLFGGFGVPQAARGVKGALTLLANAPRAPLAGSRAAQRGVIKAPGGNWLSGSIEDALKGLKREPAVGDVKGKELDDLINLGLIRPEGRDIPVALNTWIDKKLANYVRNDMATERDPIRALAERGILHVDPAQLNFRPETHGKYLEQGQTAVAVNPAAKSWEGASDLKVFNNKVRDYQATKGPLYAANPWLEKVAPDADIHSIAEARVLPQDLGFDHLIDELRNAVDVNSGLPPQLRLKPEDLAKVTVPQAVQRVAQINQWRAEQKAAADLARANNAATVLHKDYPEQGYKWVELRPGEQLNPEYELKQVQGKNGSYWDLRKPGAPYGHTTNTELEAIKASNRKALEDALKYEGDTMGHCVGGYCPDVLEGRSRIFSLRDAKGQPHVTVEVAPGRVDRDYLRSLPDPDHPKANEGEFLGTNWTFEDYVNRHRKGNGDQESFALQALAKHGHSLPPEKIVQIKGKQNRKPNDEYLPFVQDFVRSGKWSDVGDLQNTGLLQATRGRFQYPEGAGGGWMPRFDELGIPEGYYTNDELVSHIQNVRKKAGYAEGGSVSGKAPTWQDAYEEFQKAHREQYGIGIDRPWSKDEDAARAKQQIDQRYIDALNRYDPTLTPDASVLGVNAQPNTYVPKPDKGGWFSQQLSNVGNIFRPVVQGVDDLWKDTTQAASSTVNEAAQLGSEATGGILSPDAVKVLAAAAYLASTGDFANAAKMTAPEAMGEIALSSAPEFAWTDAVASSLNPSLLGSPTISGLGGATYSDAVLAQLIGEGGRMGLNVANVGQTADQILAARNATDFLSANTPGLFKTGAGMAGGPVGSLTADIGGAVLKGAPLTQAATGAVGSLALGKAVQEAAKQTGLPPQLLAVGANTGITGTAPTTQDLGKIAVSTYAADQARQRRAPRRRV